MPHAHIQAAIKQLCRCSITKTPISVYGELSARQKHMRLLSFFGWKPSTRQKPSTTGWHPDVKLCCSNDFLNVVQYRFRWWIQPAGALTNHGIAIGDVRSVRRQGNIWRSFRVMWCLQERTPAMSKSSGAWIAVHRTSLLFHDKGRQMPYNEYRENQTLWGWISKINVLSVSLTDGPGYQWGKKKRSDCFTMQLFVFKMRWICSFTHSISL